MARFIPAQLQTWTDGLLLQTPEAQQHSERFYRGISTDTRTLRSGEAFLALIGENFDGHKFVDQAIAKGCKMLILNEKSEQAMQLYYDLLHGKEIPDLLLVQDTLKAYQKIAEGYRLTLLAPVIGITGSVGKTTTRRMVGAILNTQMKLHQTSNNENNQIGLPLTLLEADDEDEVILAEMGMDRRGEIKILSEVAHPDIAIITSVGYSHSEYLGSRKNILEEKTDIISGMKSNGIVLINGQDTHLNAWATSFKGTTTVWRICNEYEEIGSDFENFPVFWAENLKIETGGTSFIAKTTLDPEVAWPVKIKAPGKYLIRAALFGLASAYALGLDMDLAVEGCLKFTNTGNRQRIVQKDGLILIDDSYNSSPESNTAALDTLSMIAGPRRKIACISAMRELGKYAEDLHTNIGYRIADLGIDILYLVGEESKWIEAGVRQINPALKIKTFPDSASIAEDIIDIIEPGDCILVKGSRSFAMEKISQKIEVQEFKF
ncbi:MAG TPA: UDP-N-acetylmuramoyl-tripeptide--D-alanyl-D-alanine ligase [Clostridiaceae bacterium]|nr:UDP-N-acetylmuramoyl-tripeptide--D-alanyl-D-alanine ligase [Clostridiaceae bacterium]